VCFAETSYCIIQEFIKGYCFQIPMTLKVGICSAEHTWLAKNITKRTRRISKLFIAMVATQPSGVP
jgi:hypothetical protein